MTLAIGGCAAPKEVGSRGDTTGADSTASESDGSASSGDGQTGSDSTSGGSASSGDGQTGSDTTAGRAPDWVPGDYFAGEIGARTNGELELSLAEDGTFTMMAIDCDYGVGSKGTWTTDSDGVSLLGPDSEALWFFEESLTSVRLSLGTDCNEVVASIVDADGRAREELLHRGVVCATHLDHCWQEDPPPDPLPEPGVLEYCEDPPPGCE